MNQAIKRKGELGNLSIKLDNQHKIYRISGRVTTSNLTPDQQEPMLLSSKGSLATLLLRHAHAETLHGGTQQMLQFIRQRFWIFGGRRAIKSIVIKCPSCFKQRMKLQSQYMAALPANLVDVPS